MSALVLGGLGMIVTWAGFSLVILLFVRYARTGQGFAMTWLLTTVTAVLTVSITILAIQLLEIPL